MGTRVGSKLELNNLAPILATMAALSKQYAFGAIKL